MERITPKTDLRSGIFDNILDQINCPKTFNGIKEKFKLKKIKDWKQDIENIFQELGYDLEHAYAVINDFEEYDEFEFYELQEIDKKIPIEKREYIYDDNDIYRIIKSEKELYIFTIKSKIN